MFRQIIIPEHTNLTLQLPADFVGQQVEVIAFRVEETQKTNNQYSWENALKFFGTHQISLKNYKFNRDEANER